MPKNTTSLAKTPEKTENEFSAQEFVQRHAERLKEHQSTWLSRVEANATKVAESLYAAPRPEGQKAVPEGQAVLARKVLAYLHLLRESMEKKDITVTAWTAGQVMFNYEQMRLYPMFQLLQSPKGADAYLWGQHCLELEPIQRKIACLVSKQGVVGVQDLFEACWGSKHFSNEKRKRNSLRKAICELNKVLLEKDIGQIHLRDENVTFEPYPELLPLPPGFENIG